MKDFYDIWLISRQIPFEGKKLKEAIRRTFTKRQTPIPDQPPYSFQPDFAEQQQRIWSQFAANAGVEDIPDSFVGILEDLSDFLLPLCVSLNENEDYVKRWQPGAGW
ncbi:MAG: nucleotidyl transferase AbiEii/AbiGii toxin family protein, partial [Anaerolineales bacterium]|nr:nucleotidyl transferase AbiEii/AbiGii toxin family protein [Anaerolineales bacterium]